MPTHLARTLLTALLLAAGLLTQGCSTNPATGKRSFTLLSWEQERAMGSEAAPQFTEQFGGEVPSPRATAYVTGVGNRLVEGVEPGVPQLEWEFTLLDSPVINAFALPGGKVFFSRGLAEELDNEAQMAGVIGHEIGHVTARHGNQRMSQQIGFNALITGLAVGVGVADADSDFRQVGQLAVPALAIGGNVVLLKYGRDEESEADMLGMRYMARAGYNPRGQLSVMEVLRDASAGSGRPPEWLSTHPYPETRMERIQEILGERYAHTRNNPDYGLFPERYQDQMLDELARLPPPPEPSARAPVEADERAAGPVILATIEAGEKEFDPGDPASWCGHCAHAGDSP